MLDLRNVNTKEKEEHLHQVWFDMDMDTLLLYKSPTFYSRARRRPHPYPLFNSYYRVEQTTRARLFLTLSPRASRARRARVGSAQIIEKSVNTHYMSQMNDIVEEFSCSCARVAWRRPCNAPHCGSRSTWVRHALRARLSLDNRSAQGHVINHFTWSVSYVCYPRPSQENLAAVANAASLCFFGFFSRKSSITQKVLVRLI